MEFGAGDGEFLSNTVMLEREFGWTGILAEPLDEYRGHLESRRSAAIETCCVWSETGAILDFVQAGYLSTADEYRDADFHASSRKNGRVRQVETISLLDLLKKHGAPQTIDFLSIDTEGSEFRILEAFPFGGEYDIDVIACEHNFSEQRMATLDLLQRNGYARVAESISAHDDWFIRTASSAFTRWHEA